MTRQTGAGRKPSMRFSPEVRERAVRLVQKQLRKRSGEKTALGGYASARAALPSRDPHAHARRYRQPSDTSRSPTAKEHRLAAMIAP